MKSVIGLAQQLPTGETIQFSVSVQSGVTGEVFAQFLDCLIRMEQVEIKVEKIIPLESPKKKSKPESVKSETVEKKEVVA